MHVSPVYKRIADNKFPRENMPRGPPVSIFLDDFFFISFLFFSPFLIECRRFVIWVPFGSHKPFQRPTILRAKRRRVERETVL